MNNGGAYVLFSLLRIKVDTDMDNKVEDITTIHTNMDPTIVPTTSMECTTKDNTTNINIMESQMLVVTAVPALVWCVVVAVWRIVACDHISLDLIEISAYPNLSQNKSRLDCLHHLSMGG